MESAAYFGNFNRLQNLLAQGVAVDKPDKYGNTALYWAAVNGNVEIVGYLVQAGADVNLASNQVQETALHAACRNGHELVVKLLLKYPSYIDLYYPDNYRMYRANPNVVNVMGSLPLHLAVLGGYLAITDILCKLTESLNLRDKDHLTPLHCAVMKGHYKATKLLLHYLESQGLSMNKRDDMGYTALHWAVSLQRDDIIRLLVEYDVNLNKQDIQKETPLFLAIRNGSEHAVVYLLQNGASPDIRNNEYPIVFLDDVYYKKRKNCYRHSQVCAPQEHFT
jgi:ankyrin repeat protein